jgi:iron complex outermembrane receptor protein
MNKRTRSVLLTGVAAAALSPNVMMAATAAETTAADSGDEFTEIIVTARRTEENLQDVPISITVGAPLMVGARVKIRYH